MRIGTAGFLMTCVALAISSAVSILIFRQYSSYPTPWILIICMNALLVVLASSIVWVMVQPINKVRQNIDEITKGNLGVELGKSPLFEIQNLIESLDRILASMKLAIMRTGATKEDIGIGFALKAKEEAEEKYRQLVDSVPEMIWEFDENEIFIFCSKAYKQILGYEPEELVGKSAFSIMPRDDVDNVRKEFNKLKQKRKPLVNLINKNLTKSGEVKILISNAVPIIDKEGKYKGYRGIDRDISREREAETKYRKLFITSTDALMTLDPITMQFTSGNPAVLRMFNVKDENQFISLGPSKLSPKYQPDGKLSSIKSKEMVDKAMKEGSNFFEWTHKRYKGEPFPATVLLSRVNDGEDYIQATVRDLSKEKAHEFELKGIEALKNIAKGRTQIIKERENVTAGRENIVGRRETTAASREKIVGRREKIKKGHGREGIAKGREDVAGRRERTATGRENVVKKRERAATKRERFKE